MPDATDCLIIGFNEGDFPQYVDLLRAQGERSGGFRDLRLAYADYRGQPHRALDLLNTLRSEIDPGLPTGLSNVDFVAPAILVLGSRLLAAGLSVDYANLFQQDNELLVEKLRSEHFRSVAITTTLYVYPEPVREIVALVRKIAPETTVIVGGPYIANQARIYSGQLLEELLDYLGCDIYVFAREGEATLAAVVQNLRDNRPLDEVPNLGFRSAKAEEGYIFTPTQVEDNDLGAKIDYRKFGFPGYRSGRFVSVRTAKSCPFHCAFCAFPAHSGKYTYLNINDVERKLDEIAAIGTIDTLSFIDDTFNVPRRRFESVLQLLIRKQYPFKWNCFYRSDHGNDDIIAMMKAAGCEGVFLGVESGSDAMLERMQKSSRRRHYTAALRGFREAGISTYASFIIGFPGETRDTFRETASLIEEERPDYFRAQLWYCDPVTPVYQSRERYGIRGEAFNWRHNTMDASEAADMIEALFLSARNSTWMPQWGFEQWSTFYLQRLGMTRAQVCRYVKLFNGMIGEQITGRCADAVQSPLLPEVRELSMFGPR